MSESRNELPQVGDHVEAGELVGHVSPGNLFPDVGVEDEKHAVWSFPRVTSLIARRQETGSGKTFRVRRLSLACELLQLSNRIRRNSRYKSVSSPLEKLAYGVAFGFGRDVTETVRVVQAFTGPATPQYFHVKGGSPETNSLEMVRLLLVINEHFRRVQSSLQYRDKMTDPSSDNS